MFGVSSAWFNAQIALFWWPFTRILALFATEPFFSSNSIPLRLKVFFAVILTITVAPVLPAPPVVEPFSAVGMLISANQIIIGLAMGFSVRMAFSAVELAGNLIGLQMGLGFASFFDPQHAQQLPILAVFASLFAMLLYLAFDGHLVVISVLVDSFHTLPISTDPLHSLGFRQMAVLGGLLFRYGVLLAMPVIAALLIANLCLGVMARAAPQFNLFAVGFPLLLALGLLAFTITLPQFAQQFQAVLQTAIGTIAGTLSLLHPAQ